MNEAKRLRTSIPKTRRHLLPHRLLLLLRRDAAVIEIHGNGGMIGILIVEVVVETITIVIGLLLILRLFENVTTSVEGLAIALLPLFILIETAVVDILLLIAVRLLFHLTSALVEMTMMAAVEALEVVLGTAIEGKS